MGSPGWDEDDSRAFIDHGRIFVPDREEQIETLLGLIPPSPRHVVELCCGDGALAGAVLGCFPGCAVHAYDRSPAMLEHARAALADHGERFEGILFDLADRSWRNLPWKADAILSSLAVHHLDGAGKRELFRDMAQALPPEARCSSPTWSSRPRRRGPLWPPAPGTVRSAAARSRSPGLSARTRPSAPNAGTTTPIPSRTRSISRRLSSTSSAGWRRRASPGSTSTG